MKDYVLSFEYVGGKAFHALLNGHIFMDTPGYTSGMQSFFPTPFLMAGENTLRIVGGKMSPTGELEGKILPEMDICLAQITSFSDNATTPIQTFSFSNVDDSNGDVKKDNDERESYDIVFLSPARNDYTNRFNSFTKLNTSEDTIDSEILKMKYFSNTLHAAFLDENFDCIAEVSHIKLTDGLEQAELTYKNMEKEYINGLLKIKKQGIGYLLESNDQFVFCPSCDGKIWRIAIMESPEQAKIIQDAIKMLPAALPPFEYELFQSSLINNAGRKLPSYIASVDEQFYIVR